MTLAADSLQFRVLLCSGCPRQAPVASLAQLTAAAKKAAKASGLTLQVDRAACLSACSSGPSALLESPDGVVRLRQVTAAAQLARAVAAASQLVSAHPLPDDLQELVLSRLLWADLDGEG